MIYTYMYIYENVLKNTTLHYKFVLTSNIWLLSPKIYFTDYHWNLIELLMCMYVLKPFKYTNRQCISNINRIDVCVPIFQVYLLILLKYKWVAKRSKACVEDMNASIIIIGWMFFYFFSFFFFLFFFHFYLHFIMNRLVSVILTFWPISF